MIDWKTRFKNKAFIVTFIPSILALIYNILGVFGIIPGLSQDTLTDVLVTCVNVLVTLGIITDPTTNGFSDKSGQNKGTN